MTGFEFQRALSIHFSYNSLSTAQFFSLASHAVLKCPILILNAALPLRPLRLTMDRITGSRDNHSASLTSSQPVVRPYTNLRSRLI